MGARQIGELQIDDHIYEAVTSIAQGTGVEVEDFFNKLEAIIRDLAPRNAELLEKRREFERQINAYFTELKASGRDFDKADYTAFLKSIGYIVPEREEFEVGTQNVDAEIAAVSGPQLVTPVDKAQLALKARNGRWGSIFDAFYGQAGDQNVIDETDGKEIGDGYNPARGDAVIAKTNDTLDEILPLDGASYADVERFTLVEHGGTQLLNAILKDDRGTVGLQDPDKLVGFSGDDPTQPESILLKNKGLHVELRTRPLKGVEKVVREHHGGERAFYDVQMEAAVTTIMDMEDSVAAVDAQDKALVYSNWAGLMRGDLEHDMGSHMRRMNPDKEFTTKTGEDLTMPGGSMLLVRNVGQHLYTDAVTFGGRDIPEGFLDAMVSVLGAMHDLKSAKNSKHGSIYIVKPKMHGPDEVAATSELFGRVEDALGLERNTIKLGIMDEEQRTSVNLGECERAAKDRVVFINTGFLDRTGDLLHTAMKAGPMETKANIQGGSWLDAYERSNVITGLRTMLQRVGQIGKGMWARSTDKAGLLDQKHNHPEAGANTAWVPNPMAAVLHAIHYHTRDVDAIQAALSDDLTPVEKAEILNLPLLTREMGAEERLERLDEYAQSLLGYVVHWVDNGVGCSAIPNFEDVKLMEDLATLRIGSQLLANWLEHGIITQDEVIASFGKMAKRVDGQSTKVANYNNMAVNYDGPAFQTALDLVFHGTEAENGYTEASLREARRDVKLNGPQRGGVEPKWQGGSSA